MRRIIASLDIGSNTIKLVVGEIFKKHLNILAVNEIPSQGIKNGIVINGDLTLGALEELFNRTKKILDLDIKEVVVNVVSYDLETMIVSGEVNILNEDNIIKSSDVVRVLEEASLNRLSNNREVVNLSPIKFRVDDVDTINPVGSYGNKLAVKAVLASVPKKNYYGIMSVLEKLNINVVDVSVSGAADYYTYRNDIFDSTCGAIINIGADITNISVINKGIITASNVLELGGSNIDSDLSFVYNITKSDGKLIKEKLGHATDVNTSINEVYNLTNKEDEIITINQKECSLVIESRLKEILTYAKKQINLLTKKEISYIIITGGISELKDFNLLIESIFGADVTLGNIGIMGVRNNKYSTCVGLIKYYDYKLRMKKQEYSVFDDEQLKELTHKHRSSNKVFDKLFGYFFDN